MKYRIGNGFDVHKFAKGRKLILGGIEIPNKKGLAGHSDADVLLHAITDALLGSLALGDIGKHFPDNDDKYKNIDSSVLLKNAYELVRGKGYVLGNLDSVIVIQKPKLAKFIPQIEKKIASILKTNSNQVSVKATTTERLGFTGREEGVAAYVTVLVVKAD